MEDIYVLLNDEVCDHWRSLNARRPYALWVGYRGQDYEPLTEKGELTDEFKELIDAIRKEQNNPSLS